jgi:hypothetical protein
LRTRLFDRLEAGVARRRKIDRSGERLQVETAGNARL